MPVRKTLKRTGVGSVTFPGVWDRRPQGQLWVAGPGANLESILYPLLGRGIQDCETVGYEGNHGDGSRSARAVRTIRLGQLEDG